MTVVDAESPIVKPIGELFRADCVALWGTTYNIDLALFNEYLLGRLGDPPLNAVVLADRDRLDATLSAVPPERVDVLGPVNRKWLLRGARVGAGRFHPKSYLSVTQRGARLLVGSGNLSTNGIDIGRELFTVFLAGTPIGDAAIRTWRAWMRRLVDEVGDTLLADRFIDLEERLPKSATPTAVVESPLLHNLDEPLADQLCGAVLSHVDRADELIVTAPFYDEAGEALGHLVDRLSPARVRVYIATSTNVNGADLSKRLAASGAQIELLSYVPDRFTHAKLIGIVAGDRGWALSGSANLSRAALTLGPGAANVELAVLVELDAVVVRHLFLPPGVMADPVAIESLAELTFDSSSDEHALASVRITAATFLPDSRIRIESQPSPDPSWRLADHSTSQGLIVDGTSAATVAPLSGTLVHLIDAGGVVLSNYIVADDPVALHRVLQVGERAGSGRPTELTATDLETPLGQALLFLHRNVVMDVSETAARGGGGDASRDEAAGEATDDDLWSRLEKEKLGRDPRAGTYGRLLGKPADPNHGLAEPLVELLEAMRDRAPDIGTGTLQSPSLLQVLARSGGVGARWSATAKIRVRARNVLTRWAAAQTDPRLTWVDPLAPLGNLAMVAAIFGQLWCSNASPDAVAELTGEDLDDLWARWFRPFVGSGKGDGWLDTVDAADERVRRHLEGDFARNATVLCWLAIRPGKERRKRVVAWQPYLRAAFEKGLIEVEQDTAEFLTATGNPVDEDRVTEDLLRALDFIDDELWCEQTAGALGLSQLTLEAASATQRAAVRLRVRGVDNPLHDPRIPQLVVAVCRYRSTGDVALFGLGIDWRLVVSDEDPVLFKLGLDAPMLEASAVGAASFEVLVASQGVVADMFPADARVA